MLRVFSLRTVFVYNAAPGSTDHFNKKPGYPCGYPGGPSVMKGSGEIQKNQWFASNGKGFYLSD